VTPAETIKVKLIHDKLLEQPKYRGLIHGIMEITKAQGLGGIYRGVVPTILRQGSNQGIRFLVYDDVSKILKVNLQYNFYMTLNLNLKILERRIIRGSFKLLGWCRRRCCFSTW
jgi:hypothetical protein